MTEESPEHIILVDGSGYIFRAYYGLPPLTRADGTPVNAVLGFCNILFKLLEDTLEKGTSSHLAVIFDTARKTFRNDIYADYKANRPPPPEDLIPQFDLIREAVRAFNVPSVAMAGFEADDLIATYAREAREKGWGVTIISSDKDLMQLVGGPVVMFDPMKNRTIGPDQVREKFGVGPERVIDVQALAGDSSDNVPGVPGIGIKTAAELINTYGDLDSVLARAGEIKQPKRRENLIAHADLARVSRDLVRLAQDVPVDQDLDGFGLKSPDMDTLLGFLEAQDFRTLRAKIAGRWGQAKSQNASKDAGRDANAPETAVAAAAAPAANGGYETVTSLEALERWVARAEATGLVAVDTETTSLNALEAELVGVSLALAPGQACYVPLGHRRGQDQGQLDLGEPSGNGEVAAKSSAEGLVPGQIPLAEAMSRLKPLLEDPAVLKVAHNAKYDLLVLRRQGIEMAPVDDTMLISYALGCGAGRHGLDALSRSHLDHENIPFKEVAGSGKSQVTFDRVAVDRATEYAAEDADMTFRLHALLKPRLVPARAVAVYETLERPLVPVLADMEEAGIRVDSKVLSSLSKDFAARMEVLEAEIFKLAGHPFNVASPKQLGEVLFDEMSLEGGKKSKTGAYSTSAEVLEKLAAGGHDLPARVLDWRQLAKLRSTYTEALLGQINDETGRVHTSFSLAATSTGRLASSDPNLQNIPIRTEEGRKIRKAFTGARGTRLLSADYSQIELRLLAHIAGIDALKTAFAGGADIHAMTASEIFGVPVEGMDPQVRRRAKAINFGIIYGISAFGLARQLGISRSEAAAFIETYFERFPGIRDYMEQTKEFCRRHGYVETVFGRRCHVRGINDRNPNERAFAERAAINAPIQGSAADVIRRAMIRMPAALREAGLAARMLLQVHDELLFEVPDAEVEATAPVVKSVMESAAGPAQAISVALTVEIGSGGNWAEAH